MEYWKKVDKDGNTTTVESHSFPHKVPDAVRITERQYNEFIASLPVVEPEPVRDLEAEIANVNMKLDKLEEIKEVTPSEMAT